MSSSLEAARSHVLIFAASGGSRRSTITGEVQSPSVLPGTGYAAGPSPLGVMHASNGRSVTQGSSCLTFAHNGILKFHKGLVLFLAGGCSSETSRLPSFPSQPTSRPSSSVTRLPDSEGLWRAGSTPYACPSCIRCRPMLIWSSRPLCGVIIVVYNVKRHVQCLSPWPYIYSV